MKRIIILFMVLGLFSVKVSFAGNGELFTYDANAIKQELQVLEIIDQLVEQNEFSYKEMLQMDALVASVLNYGSICTYGVQTLEPVAGIPSFVWGVVPSGCVGLTGCLVSPLIGIAAGAAAGIAGVAFVYLSTDDSEETKKAAYGCASGVALTTISALLLFTLYIAAVAGA
jgi:hypothetical protein